METILNPFGHGQAIRVIDENHKVWPKYLSTAVVYDENEFYVLFEDGLLVKKGRSKFTTSQYINGERFKTLREHYAAI
jgi:hypothetical protein